MEPPAVGATAAGTTSTLRTSASTRVARGATLPSSVSASSNSEIVSFASSTTHRFLPFQARSDGSSRPVAAPVMIRSAASRPTGACGDSLEHVDRAVVGGPAGGADVRGEEHVVGPVVEDVADRGGDLHRPEGIRRRDHAIGQVTGAVDEVVVDVDRPVRHGQEEAIVGRLVIEAAGERHARHESAVGGAERLRGHASGPSEGPDPGEARITDDDEVARLVDIDVDRILEGRLGDEDAREDLQQPIS